MKKILIASLVALFTLFSLAWLYSNILKPTPLEYRPVMQQYDIPRGIPSTVPNSAYPQISVKKENVSLKESFESAHKRTE
jgi:hypothetical protein